MKLLSVFSLACLPAALAAEYQCPLPEVAKSFSAIIKNNMNSAAHTVYSGVAVGKTYKNTIKPSQNVAVNGASYVGTNLASNVNWNGGITTGSTLEDVGIDWAYFEYMAKNAIPSQKNGYKIVRLTKGGTYDTYDFRNGGQGEDNGKTIVFFDTTQNIKLTKTSDGRQFGPTVIAPFSWVELTGQAGYLDGLIVAKGFTTSGGQAGQLQLHGDYFRGEIPCLTPYTPPTPTPTLTPTTPTPTGAPTPTAPTPTAPTPTAPTPTAPTPTAPTPTAPTPTAPTPTAPTPTAPTPTAPTPPITPTAPTPTAPTPGGKGDPHFKTWKNEHFEYHGQCDMILLKDDNFANGLGIEVQIRTKLVRHWSYIKNAAIRIGTEILELEGSADPSKGFRFWYNFEKGTELNDFAGFPVTFKSRSYSNYKSGLEIDLDSMYPGVKIVLATWKEFVRVDFKNPTEASFGNSVGLLGDFYTGKTLARDGTVLDDFNTYGNDWQVLPTENMLFHIVEDPQFPKKCIEPEDPQGERRRRLDESSVTEEKAEAACASIADELDRKDCVYDIVATQDLEMVGAY